MENKEKSTFTIFLQKRKKQLGIFCRGLVMGTADVVPGVSGGTIALITGIYPRLITAVESFGFKHIQAIFELLFFFPFSQRRIKSFAKIKELDWVFLLPLLAGIILALIIMTRIIPFFLENYAFFTYSFFSGLILISITIPLRQMQKRIREMTLLLISGVSFFFLTSLQNTGEGDTRPLILLLSGALSICVMILPGISGSYVLVLLGQYRLIAEAARDGDFSILVFFITGMIIGILLFVRILRFFLHRYLSLSMAVLTGMMIGSLNGIWPLRFVTEEMESIELWLGGMAMAIVGCFVVILLEYLSSRSHVFNISNEKSR